MDRLGMYRTGWGRIGRHSRSATLPVAVAVRVRMTIGNYRKLGEMDLYFRVRWVLSLVTAQAQRDARRAEPQPCSTPKGEQQACLGAWPLAAPPSAPSKQCRTVVD